MNRKNIKDQIKEYFFINPTVKLRVRQIEREVKVPLPSAIRYTRELEQEHILKKSEVANIILYSADRTAKEFLLAKRVFNLQQLYISGLIDFLIEQLSNPAIIVFGSYAKGEDLEKSDIDLYVETLSKKQLKYEHFEKKLQRKIQLFVHKNIHEVKNKDLANNIINGIVVNGFVEVFR